LEKLREICLQNNERVYGINTGMWAARGQRRVYKSNMKKLLVIFLLSITSMLGAQTRNDLTFFVEPTEGGAAGEREFFNSNILMELQAAQYKVLENKAEAEWLFALRIAVEQVVPDPDDPTMMMYEYVAATGNEPPGTEKTLELKVIKNDETQAELISLGHPYIAVEEMYEWNLYLVFQAIANIPLGPPVEKPPVWVNPWRDKWLYLGLSGGFGIGNTEVDSHPSNSNLKVSFEAMGFAEVQFFDIYRWFSLRANAEGGLAIFPFANTTLTENGEILDKPFFLSSKAALTVGPIFKPHDRLMIEPYVGVLWGFRTFNWTAGVQLGAIGNTAVENPIYIFDLRWAQGFVKRTFQILFSIGVKFGLMVREWEEEEEDE
jgi:hypothetical protein